MSTMLAGIVLYVLAQFAIGVWVSRKVASVSDFIVAGRSLGPLLVTFSVFATFFGAEAVVGTGGTVYEAGLAGAEVDPFGYGLAILIVALVFAGALWRRGLLTFADLFRQRYSPAVETVVVLALLPGSIFWAAAQIRAFGQVVGSASGISVELAIFCCALIVAGYSVLGGLLADAWTDFIQGIAIIIGLLVLAAMLALDQGGVATSLTRIEADRLAWSPGADGWLALAESLAVPICGTIVAVEMVSRILAARSGGTAVRGATAGGLLYIAVGLIPVYIALAGAAEFPGLDDAEQIIPQLAEKHLPPLLAVIFLGALISAILSTVDTVLLASAAQFSRNLLFRIAPPRDPGQELLFTRLTLVALAMVTFVLALNAETVKGLVAMASSVGSSGVFVVAVFGLFTRFGGPAAAIASVSVGISAWLLGGHVVGLDAPFVTAVGLSAATYVAVAVLESRNQKTS